jgi:hypothetical protein
VRDLFRKGIKHAVAPVHVLVAISNDASSTFLLHLLRSRLDIILQNKAGVIRKLEAISTLPLPDCHHIDAFSVLSVTQWARAHDFTCVVLPDDANSISLAVIAAVACGRADLIHCFSTDDVTHYAVPVLRPARQCLRAEADFYCRHHQLTFSEEPSLFERAFAHEKTLLDDVVADGHAATAFAVQKLAERLPEGGAAEKCDVCGLPNPGGGPCAICRTVARA